jgi:hypothetical protein
MKKNIVIIAGAAGEIGAAYVKSFLEKEYDVLAVVRTKILPISHKNLKIVKMDLTSAVDIKNSMDKFQLFGYDSVTYIHSIGLDKFNPRGYPHITKMHTIDPQVYEQVNTFKYLLKYLVHEIATYNGSSSKKISLKCVAIGGTSDKYTPFVIEDFCESKFIIKQYLRNYTERYFEWFTSLIVNVTSTITESALKVRPFADTTYWLTPDEVVMRSIDDIEKQGKGYSEKDLYKYNPNYYPGYYEDDHTLYKKWVMETGYAAEANS